MRRLYARFACDIEVEIHIPTFKKPVKGRLLNISNSGALLAIRSDIRGKEVQIDLPRPPEKPLRLKATVIRNAPPDPKDRYMRRYGLQFRFMIGDQNRLKPIVDRLRGGSSGANRALKRDYWNLSKKPRSSG